MLTPTPTPMPTTPNFNCNSPPFLIKIKRRAKNEIYHFAIEMLSLPSNHIEACVPKNKLSTVYYFYEKNLPYSDLWDLKKYAFLLAVKFAEVSYFNSTSIIWLINQTMLHVLYRSRECLDHPDTYHMELLTYVLQNIETNKLMFSRSNTNDPVWLRTFECNLYVLLLIMWKHWSELKYECCGYVYRIYFVLGRLWTV